ncbi:unnamed protein product [Bemisia tabaci]|uniref:Uncharacterized protein n=1 Tax=Bemisia tabaci TaxID=7038 RepID=A0A9P0A1F8_BEMTA|nr:unnamed protein product [Bemisia tabaci]
MILQEKSLKIKIFLAEAKSICLAALLRCCAFERVAGNQQSPANCNPSVLIQKNDGLSNHLGDHREKPSIEDVELDLRKKGIFAYYFLATALPTVSSMIAGDAVPSPPKLEDLDPSQYQETMGTYMQNLRERGGVGTTEILADILRFMIDEDFIFER